MDFTVSSEGSFQLPTHLALSLPLGNTDTQHPYTLHTQHDLKLHTHTHTTHPTTTTPTPPPTMIQDFLQPQNLSSVEWLHILHSLWQEGSSNMCLVS